MKKYQLHTKTIDILNRFPALCKHLENARTRARNLRGAAHSLLGGGPREGGRLPGPAGQPGHTVSPWDNLAADAPGTGAGARWTRLGLCGGNGSGQLRLAVP